MSHSIRKIPVVSTWKGRAFSEKLSKQFSNRRLRARNRIRILNGFEPLILREVSNVWDWPSDGKYYLRNPSPEVFRK